MLVGFLYDLSNWKINSGDEFWTLVHDRYFVLKCVVHRIYACVLFLMYFDVCQNEILIKCHVETRKTDSTVIQKCDIRPDFLRANLTLKIGNRAWTVKNWNFHNCSCFTTTYLISSSSSSFSCKKSSSFMCCCSWSY